MNEFCKKHNVDHTGSICGGCFELYRERSERLKKENQLLKERLEAADKVIEFYGDRKNWSTHDMDKVAYHQSVIKENDVQKINTNYYSLVYSGGKRARTYLEKYKGTK